jgi:hypothetical protein
MVGYSLWAAAPSPQACSKAKHATHSPAPSSFWLGEIRYSSFEQQRHRATALNLLTAVVVLCNTVYLDRVIATLNGTPPSPELFHYFSPLSWEHINRQLHLARATRKPGSYREFCRFPSS